MKKLLQNRGETILESLVSILIVTLIMLFLSGAIVTAARVNKRLRDTKVSFELPTEDTQGTPGMLTITSPTDGTFQLTAPIQVFESNGYVYYRHGTEASKP